jgi:hypothetical protein
LHWTEVADGALVEVDVELLDVDVEVELLEVEVDVVVTASQPGGVLGGPDARVAFHAAVRRLES